MKQLITILLIALFAINISAETFTVNDIKYNITSANTVEVTEKTPLYAGSITIPSSVTFNNTSYSVIYIGDEAFYDCNGLTSITIPNSVTSIGNFAFANCYSLTSVTIGNSVTSIGEGAFYDCNGLTSINIPNSVTSIENWAFVYCSDLTSITIPNSVTSIGDGAFSGCIGLTSINVAIDNLNYASIDGVLYNKNIKTLIQCPGAKTSVIIPNSITSIGNFAFYCCIGLTSIAIPNLVISIGEGAFATCISLTSITIPNLVTSIRENAFSSCIGLTSVTIGSSVTSIRQMAFENCSSLTSITCHAIVPPILGWNVFNNVPKSIPLYVPAGSVNVYKATDQWKDFYKMWIVGIEPQFSIVNSPLSINVYPNPTASDLHIDIKGGDKSNINFEIINMQGQIISNGNLEGNTTLQTKELEAGVYFIKFINEQQSIDILKFIKQ